MLKFEIHQDVKPLQKSEPKTNDLIYKENMSPRLIAEKTEPET